MKEVKNKEKYQRLVGRLVYLSQAHTDTTFAVSMVSQFMHAPRLAHFEAVYRILGYLKVTPGKGILFKKHGHLMLKFTLMPIGLVAPLIEDLRQATVPLLEGI